MKEIVLAYIVSVSANIIGNSDPQKNIPCKARDVLI